MKRCFVSYMTNDRDLKGILVINYALIKYKSNYEYIVLCCDRVSDLTLNVLNQNNIKIMNIDFKNDLVKLGVNYDIIDYLYNKHFYHNFYVFLLNDYDECVYLDADLLILKNIDELFLLLKNHKKEENIIYMVNDLLENTNKDLIIVKNCFNAGVIIFKPNNLIFYECINEIKKYELEFIKKKFHSDQTIFNILNFNEIIQIKPLQFKYNIMPAIIDFFIKNNIFEENDISIIHYTLNCKPWQDIYNRSISNNVDIKYIMKWLDLYNEFVYYHFSKNIPDKKYNNIISYEQNNFFLE